MAWAPLLAWWLSFEGWCPRAKVARRKKCNLSVPWRPELRSPMCISSAFCWSEHSEGQLQGSCNSPWEGENLGVHLWRLWRLVSKEVYCQPIVIFFFVILLIKISWFSLVALKILCLWYSIVSLWNLEIQTFYLSGLGCNVHLHLEESGLSSILENFELFLFKYCSSLFSLISSSGTLIRSLLNSPT